jgi:hypothetical protein
MRGIKRALLFTIAIGTFTAGTLLAQYRGGAGRVTLPSSTAIGAGALSAGPSATARSTGPAFGRSGYLGPRTYSRAGTYTNREYTNREYRRLPRSYVIAPYYYPFFDWSGGTDYANAPAPYDENDYVPYGPDPNTDAMLRSQAALGQQVQRLTDQVNGLMYGPGGPQQQAAAPPQTPAPIPLTLILRNGEHLQVQNYAVTDNTFWDFTQRGTRKIPLSNIDVNASIKATQANGGEFPQLDGTPGDHQ